MNSQLRPFQQLKFRDVPEMPRLAHPFFEAEERNVHFRSKHYGEVDVRVRVMGKGEPLLLIHGLMTAGYSFRYVIGELAKHFTVHVPDLIGAGDSSKPSASYLPDPFAESIGELVDALGITGAPAVGNSMGGYLLMRLALLRPNALRRIVNLHSPGVPTAKMWALSAALMAVADTDKLLGWVVGMNPERWVHTQVHYFDESLKSREEHREYARALQSEGGMAAFTRMLSETLDPSEMAAFNRRLKNLSRFPVPLQLLYAERDPLVPPVVGARLSKLIPDAELRWMKNASHFAHVDAPEAFLENALPFLQAR